MKKSSRWLIRLGLLVVVVMGAWAFVIGPTSADIRLDTGDLRYRYFGIPLVYERMPEPARSRLRALTSQLGDVGAEWRQCARFPLPTTNNTDSMCQRFYFALSAWMDEDPRIALILARDVVNYIRKMNNHDAALNGGYLLVFLAEYAGPDKLKVRPDWRQRQEVRYYLDVHGIVLDADDSHPHPQDVSEPQTLPSR